MSNVNEQALELHKKHQGKLAVASKVPLKSAEDLTLAYTPGVAAPCLAIQEDKRKAYDYTSKGNMVAVVTNGTAVLGLGNIGALAGLPVMEGKGYPLQGFCRRRCRAYRFGYSGAYGGYQGCSADGTVFRRHQSGGHQSSTMFRY